VCKKSANENSTFAAAHLCLTGSILAGLPYPLFGLHRGFGFEPRPPELLDAS